MRAVGLILVALFICSSCENNERPDAIDPSKVEALGCAGAAPITYENWPAKTTRLYFELCIKHNDEIESILIDYAAGKSMKNIMPRYFKLKKRSQFLNDGYYSASPDKLQTKLEEMKQNQF